MESNKIKIKYYAVKIGIKPGIYTSWDECKDNVTKYNGAQYKSFKTLIEAQQYLLKEPTKISRLNRNIKNNTKITKLDNSKVLITKEINNISLAEFKPYINNLNNKNNGYYLFTDGSNQKTHCAFGVYFGNGQSQPYTISSTFIHYASLITTGDKTNNIAELKAIQAALFILINNIEYIDKKYIIYIISDSKYAINCSTEWYKKWRKNGWKNSKNEPVANREIIEDIVEKVEKNRELGLKLQFKHQLAHKSKPIETSGINYYLWLGNYMVDYLVQKKIINK
jgi:ribonuclease HI